MKTAYLTYICNGYSLMAVSETVNPAPVWVFAASLDEVMFYMDQYFNGAPLVQDPGADPFAFEVSDRAMKSTDPLMNQQTQIWPALPAGYWVRQMQSPAAPTRPMLDEFCPNADAVHAELTAIYTPPPPPPAAP